MWSCEVYNLYSKQQVNCFAGILGCQGEVFEVWVASFAHLTIVLGAVQSPFAPLCAAIFKTVCESSTLTGRLRPIY